MNFSTGSLVKVRGREWVVLPGSDEQLLILKPLGGSAEETAGIYLPLEKVESASFDLPDPSSTGDYRSCKMLRDALRISSRSAGGPFRSFSKLGFDPRPYQLVPLIMALKINPVRLLIADDVGIGKTIEAILILKELLDRGEIQRFAILCPPHLAEQWQTELFDKFHIEAEMLLTSTASSLESKCALGQSLFELYPYIIVSLDFIKSDRRREEFARSCPEFVIIDEAHSCAYGYEKGGGKHQRHQLVKSLAVKNERHIIFVTATPHSGNEGAFRSLLSLLNPDFTNLPENLTGQANEKQRRELAAQFIQRKRADIEHFMKTDTPFPEREDFEEAYSLTPEYMIFFNKIVEFAREVVKDAEGGNYQKRIKWWSALALLRSVGSSPAAAAATLRNRSAVLLAQSEEEINEIGRRTVFDVISEDEGDYTDVTPGTDINGADDEKSAARKKLLELALEAEKLIGAEDAKFNNLAEHTKKLIKDGFNPIIFCRFIPTAEYVAEELKKKLPNDVAIFSITGSITPAEREERVLELSQFPKRVLVCTDCLSEGINLQTIFNAVVHYDLSWNPARHEQREGRVDRYGQLQKKVRVMTYYGIDNKIDGIVLDVLVRKHKKIKSSLGISVPVPVNSDNLVEAIFEGLLLRESEGGGSSQMLLPGIEEYIRPNREKVHKEWEESAEREKRSRTVFAQEAIKVDEVSRELGEARENSGSMSDVENFVIETLKINKAVVSPKKGHYEIDLGECPQNFKDYLQTYGEDKKYKIGFEFPPAEGVRYLTRTHPMVEKISTYVVDSALEKTANSAAKRSGVIKTKAVTIRTTVLLVRFRYDITTQKDDIKNSQLIEECLTIGFSGSPENAAWLDRNEIEKLYDCKPDDNIAPEIASDFVSRVTKNFEKIRPKIEEMAKTRAVDILKSHRRLRDEANIKSVKYSVEPKLPPDILGVYVYLPVVS